MKLRQLMLVIVASLSAAVLLVFSGCHSAAPAATTIYGSASDTLAAPAALPAPQVRARAAVVAPARRPAARTPVARVPPVRPTRRIDVRPLRPSFLPAQDACPGGG